MTSATMADLAKAIAAARKSSEVSKLHAALDQTQAAITKMEGQMKDCKAMMQHMMSMQGHGTINPAAPGASH